LTKMGIMNQLNLEKMKSNEIPEIDFYAANKDLPGEKWEELIFADKLYEISNFGRLKSYATNKDGVILRNRNTNNYLTVILRVFKKRETIYIHKLVAEYFVLKEDKSKNIVIHIDNDRKNNYFENLKWVNAKECFENADRLNPKLHKMFRKNNSSAAKITRQDADEIRVMIAEGVLQSVIAKKFKISEMQITRIKRYENWKPKTKRPRISKKSKQKIYTKKSDLSGFQNPKGLE